MGTSWRTVSKKVGYCRKPSGVKPARRAAQVAAPQANSATEIELTGISTAQMTGDSTPAAAMLMPTTL
jgi:hypothetical protein